MSGIKIGTNFAVFLLFFGVAALEAVQTHNWIKASFWAAIGVVFLVADNSRTTSHPYTTRLQTEFPHMTVSSRFEMSVTLALHENRICWPRLATIAYSSPAADAGNLRCDCLARPQAAEPAYCSRLAG